MDNLENARRSIIEALGGKESIETTEIAGDYKSIIGAVKNLEAAGKIVCTAVKHRTVILTKEGENVVRRGSPEYVLYQIVGKEIHEKNLESECKECLTQKGYTEEEVRDTIRNGKNNGLRKGIIKINNGVLAQAKDKVEDEVVKHLKNISDLDKKEKEELKKRKMIVEKEQTHYLIKKTDLFYVDKEIISDITVEMLSQMDISTRLKKYNFDIVSNCAKYSGALHPLSLEREKVKKIFLQMGFEEMDAGKYVESSFWNFDALFQPQRHPSRNECDTFFLQTPSTAQDPCSEYLENVKQMHTNGAYGSIGYQAPWSVEESRKNVLRTHTTAVTTRLLYKLSKELKNTNSISGKYFSIDRVFRNESLDATHLAEFHQVEGIVIGKKLTISDLMGFLQAFFGSLGIDQIKFKPAYNPYTEPSLEVFAYHKKMQKWMEIGNSGMFRPEMLLPMGLPEDIRVIGWGLSLERPVMISREINNIRELVGYKVDLSFIRQGLGKKEAN